jgi:hypothetical protein
MEKYNEEQIVEAIQISGLANEYEAKKELQ